jgi:hypothetical protein
MSELRTNKIYPRDGLPAGSSGGIIQVKQSLYNTYDTFNNSSFAAVSGLTVSITPTRSDNKILITLNLLVEARSNSVIAVELTRGGSSIFTNEGGYRGTSAHGGYITMTYLDSPATTSAVTYGVQTRSSNGNYTFNNYIGSGPANSFITVMEVSG